MNITKEQLDESKINLNPYEMFIEMVLGEKPMVFFGGRQWRQRRLWRQTSFVTVHGIFYRKN
ncbi:MAG: hypothetical protein LBB88_03165 [Planctomycetaceae bacterium]|jgi:hypothetical protein|nr:hypothetical protein [Planctomycetaceae bacterium]